MTSSVGWLGCIGMVFGVSARASQVGNGVIVCCCIPYGSVKGQI